MKAQVPGIGGGVESRYQLLNKENLNLVISAMLDYYLESPLSGHDTVYNPSGADENPRRDYTYADADAAIRQPKLVPRIMLGVSREFGR